MFLSPSIFHLQLLLCLWLMLFATLAMATWKSRRPTAGLPLAYVFALTMVHFFGAFCYGMPQYRPSHQMLIDGGNSLLNTFYGFEVAVLGLSGFVGGWLLAGRVISDRVRHQVQRLTPMIRERMPSFLLILSLLFFFIFAPIMRAVPSLGSMGNAGTGLSVIAVCLGCWRAWEKHDTKKLLQWIVVSSVSFPFVTVIFLGFMSYGVAAATLVWLFVFSFYRPRWLSSLVLFVLVYAGMSLYINYMASRNAIRRSVWGEEAITSRIETATRMFSHFEFLSPTNNNHLELIDIRMNLNNVIGISVNYMQVTGNPFARGETLKTAAIAWIPRILWPGKPKFGGSGNIVSQYTGIKFAEGTSVGVGQVLEFYINFGYMGVFTGLFIFGVALRYFDLRAGYYLYTGDYWSFARWFLPGVAMVQPGGNLAEVVGATAAAGVFVFILHKIYFEGQYVDTRFKARRSSMEMKG